MTNMKKFPQKFKYPLIASMVLPSMLLGMTAIMARKMVSDDVSFMSAWSCSIGEVIPSALLLLAVVAPTVRLFVSKVLLESEEK